MSDGSTSSMSHGSSKPERSFGPQELALLSRALDGDEMAKRKLGKSQCLVCTTIFVKQSIVEDVSNRLMVSALGWRRDYGFENRGLQFIEQEVSPILLYEVMHRGLISHLCIKVVEDETNSASTFHCQEHCGNGRYQSEKCEKNSILERKKCYAYAREKCRIGRGI